MKSRGVRVLLVILAIVALAAAGMATWHFEERIAAERSAADTFERDARQAVIGLGDLRAALQASVAAGQAPDTWLPLAASLGGTIEPKIAALRVAAGTAEAHGALESAIEAFTTFGQSDAKARDYLKSGQQVSASDVIFADGAPMLDRVVNLIDSARGQESIAHAIAVAGARKWELIAIGAGLFPALLVLLLLVPIPRNDSAVTEAETGAAAMARGLGLSHEVDGVVRKAEPIATPARAASTTGTAAPAAAAGAAGKAFPVSPAATISKASPAGAAKPPDLSALADVCSSLARVQYTGELQGLFEPIAKALEATGVIVWMPDATYGTLRPALSHGYSPLTLMRMGVIQPTSDNATATAFRTKTVVVVPPDASAGGAIVAPLITSEGCSGAMAVELREGVEPTPHARAAAAIVAAQLAMLLTPPAAPAAGTPAATPAAFTPAAGPTTRKG
jgi:hypothetical protein